MTTTQTPRDPFAPLSAKPLTEAERRKRRITEGAANGGKTHRGTRRGANRFLYGHPPKLEPVNGR